MVSTLRLPIAMLFVAACREPQTPAADADETGTGSEGPDESDSSTDMTTSATEDTSSGESGPECSASDDCPQDDPLCDAGSCVACDEARTVDCASERPATPVCRTEDGQCVECSSEDVSACADELPVCVDNACAPCWLHADCPASACNMETGACMPEDRVWFVDADVLVSGDGSAAAPFQSVLEVVGQIEVGEAGTAIVVTKLGHYDSIDVQNYRTLAVVNRTLDGSFTTSGEQAIWVTNNAKLFVDSFDLRSLTHSGGYCNTGWIWMRKARLEGSNDTISATFCDLHIENSTLASSGRWTIDLDGGTLELINSFVVGANDYNAIEIRDGAEASIFYSTVGAAWPDVGALRCGVDAGAGSIVRNSLIVSASNTPEIVGCPNLEITESALESAFGGNLSLGGMQMAWFEDFYTADLHLTDTIPPTLATAALWRDGDPRVDIDGDPRPTLDGTPDYAGADVPVR